MYQVNFLPWRIARQQARYRFWRNTMLIQGIAWLSIWWWC